MRKIIMGLAVVGLFSASVRSETAEGIYFSHKDWEVACDNTRTCRVAGYNEESDEQGISVLLVRQAGENQPVSGKITLSDLESDASSELSDPAQLTLIINGQNWGELTPDESSNWSLQKKQIAPLLAALVGNGQVEFQSGAKHWLLSNAGAYAVLLKMDDFQGRIGTSGALIKKGNKPESSVLPALAAPIIIAQVADNTQHELSSELNNILIAKLKQTLKGDAQCDFMEPLTLIKLNEEKSLLSTLCWLAAYNGGYGYWLIDKEFNATLITDSASNYVNGVIYLGQKGRGIGDCRLREEWVWNGTTFVSSVEMTTGMCRGIHLGGAWDLYTRVSEVKKAYSE